MQPPCHVAVLGCGRLAREVFLPLLAREAGARVVAVADPDPAALAAAHAIAPAAQVARDWRDALHVPDVDTVFILLPSAQHAEAARAAITGGVAVYLEKPIGIDADEGRALVEAWRTAPLRVPVGVGFNYRFNPLVRQLKAQLDAGAVGRVAMLRTTFTTHLHRADTWRGDFDAGGGVLLDLGSHHVDLLCHLTGREVLAVHGTRVRDPQRETIVLTLQLEDGVLATCTLGSGIADNDAIEIEGDRGILAMNRYAGLTVTARGASVPGPADRLRSAISAVRGVSHLLARRRSPWHEPSYPIALANFLACRRDRSMPVPGLEEGLRSLLVVDAAERAIREERRVDVPRPADRAAHLVPE